MAQNVAPDQGLYCLLLNSILIATYSVVFRHSCSKIKLFKVKKDYVKVEVDMLEYLW